MSDPPSKFPAVFTVESSSRHECGPLSAALLTQICVKLTMFAVFTVNTVNDTLDDLKGSMESLLASSPNAAEFLGKYRNKENKDAIKDIVVKWASEGRDKQLFPRETLLTEQNYAAVLSMMAVGVGKDVFDVKLKPQAKTEAGK